MDEKSNLDYYPNEDDIIRLVKDFKIIKKNYLTRVDESPIKHTHNILELILQKY